MRAKSALNWLGYYSKTAFKNCAVRAGLFTMMFTLRPVVIYQIPLLTPCCNPLRFLLYKALILLPKDETVYVIQPGLSGSVSKV